MFRLSVACIAVTLFVACAQAVEPTAGVPKATGFTKATVVSGLEHPWGLAFLPGGDMLVTERPGRIRLVKDGKLVEEPVKTLSDIFARGQGGLMDIILHPKFVENQWVYFTYSAGEHQANHTVLARAKFDGTKMGDVEELFKGSHKKPGTQHFGSVLYWMKDGTLLMSVGDGGNPPVKIDGMLARDQAQNLGSHNGTLLRLDENGKAAQDNPFAGKEGALPEIYTYGHRNIQGIAYDPATNRVWTTEHGPRGGDELNRHDAGKNYGWPKASFGRDYGTNELITPEKSLPGMVDPIVVWVPSTATSGLEFYTGDKFPDWKGNLFSGGLVSADLRRVVLDGDKQVKQESLPIGARVRAVRQGPDGLLYVLTDEKDGKVLRLDPQQ